MGRTAAAKRRIPIDRLPTIAGIVALATLATGAPSTAGAAARPFVAARSHAAAVRAYQGRSGPEQTERFSRRIRLGRDGRVSIANIAGDITVTGGSGDEVAIEAVKRARGSASQLSTVRIEIDERAGSVDVRTEHTAWNDRVSVDYTITVPAGASLDAHSVSGSVKVTGVRGSVRAETVSGAVSATDTPKLEAAKSVSGNVTVSGISVDGDLSASSVSGDVAARSVRARRVEVSSVSGELTLDDLVCDRLAAKSVSGSVEYTGGIGKGGSYDFNVHSGNVRLTLVNPSGFVLRATSFSGSVRSELPLTIGGDTGDRDRNNRRGRRGGFDGRSLRATYGDGSADLTVRSFSGNIVIAKR
jgi:DUF4097 and DUF4098 domain-containing protein YvlB